MKKYLIITIVVVLLICVGLSGCNDNKSNDIPNGNDTENGNGNNNTGEGNAELIGDVNIFVDSDGVEHIFGEVKNTGGANLMDVSVIFSFYDSSDNLVYIDGTIVTYCYFDNVLLPGETSPYWIMASNGLPSYEYYEIDVSWEETTTKSYNDFSVSVSNAYQGDDTYHIIGEIENTGTKTIEQITVYAVGYDSSGNILAYAWEDHDSTLEPGDSTSFHSEIWTSDLPRNVASYSVKVFED
jgi:hypothetical protein